MQTLGEHSSDEPIKPAIPWLSLMVSGVAVAAVVLYAAFTFKDLPDPMPVHWGLSGEADRWEPKEFSTFVVNLVLGPAVVFLAQLGVVMLFREVGGNGHADTEMDPAAAAARRRLLATGQLQATAWMMSGFTVATAMMVSLANTTTGVDRFEMPLFLLVMVAIMVAFAATLERLYARVDARYPLSDPQAGRPKWGIFWYEPGGPAMHNSNQGANWTPNLATTGGRIAAILLIGVPVALLVALAIAALFV